MPSRDERALREASQRLRLAVAEAMLSSAGVSAERIGDEIERGGEKIEPGIRQRRQHRQSSRDEDNTRP